MARAGADVGEAERLEKLADAALVIGDAEAAGDHRLQVATDVLIGDGNAIHQSLLEHLPSAEFPWPQPRAPQMNRR